MKILVVHNYYKNRGGECTYSKELINLLQSYGNKVHTFTKDNREINNVTSLIKTAGNLYSPAHLHSFEAVLDSKKPDLVHFNNIFPSITPFAYNLCKKRKIPVIQTIQNYRFFCPKGTLYRDNKICEECINSKLKIPAIRYSCYRNSKIGSSLVTLSSFLYQTFNLYKNVSHFLFPTTFIRDYYLQHNKNLFLNSTVIPNFLNEYKVIDQFHIKDPISYLFYAGRLSEEKGVMEFTKRFTKTNYPNIKLFIAGDCEQKAKLIKLIKTNKNIVYLGKLQLNAILYYMKHALFTVIPSQWYEVMPLVAVQSYAMGTPLLISHCKSLLSIIKPNKTGFIINNNFNNLSQYLDMTKNKTFYRNLRRNAYQMYKQNYSPQVHYQQLVDIYKKVLRN